MSGKWKEILLSSSFPLEFDTAKVLSSHEFYVGPEYKYSRQNEHGRIIDFSVDILAESWWPFTTKSRKISIDILVECKYRNRRAGSSWLFLPSLDRAFGHRARAA